MNYILEYVTAMNIGACLDDIHVLYIKELVKRYKSKRVHLLNQ